MRTAEASGRPACRLAASCIAQACPVHPHSMRLLLRRLQRGGQFVRSCLQRFVALALVCLLTACSPKTEIVQTLPAIRFITTDGAALGPEQYRGRPVLINFWSTTCSICLAEMPLLQALNEEHAEQGLVVIAAAMPYDRPSDVLELRALKKWDFYVTIDPQGKTLGQFGQIKGVPVTVLFDRDGRRAWFHQGELKETEVRKALGAVFKKPS